MDLSTIANVATSLTVLVGVAFGLVEMRRVRREREERAAFAAVQALMSPEWMSSAVLVAAMPDGTSPVEIEKNERLLDATQEVFERIWRGLECEGCRLRDSCPMPLSEVQKAERSAATAR